MVLLGNGKPEGLFSGGNQEAGAMWTDEASSAVGFDFCPSALGDGKLGLIIHLQAI